MAKRTVTISEEHGVYALIGAAVSCTGKSAEDVLIRAGKLRGFFSVDESQVTSNHQMGSLIEEMLGEKKRDGDSPLSSTEYR